MNKKAEGRMAQLERRIAELEAPQPAARTAHAKTVTQELPIDSRGMGPSYAEHGQEAQHARAAEAAARIVPNAGKMAMRAVRGPDGITISHYEPVDRSGPSPRELADAALAETHHLMRGLPVGAPDED
jgi:hypothetical protein